MKSTASRLRELERRDLVSFIGAALSCTAQDEFYGDAKGQAVSIDFFHDYVLGNYRGMYANCLAAGINDFNRARIVVNLLVRASEVDVATRRAEGRLIAAALRELPPPRVYRLFEELVALRLNNRRTRRIVAEYLESRPNPALHVLKYRRRLKSIVAHFHLRLRGELGEALFRPVRAASFEESLFEAYRRAHYEHSAIYELPYTIAEGLAARHGIPRAVFLDKIGPRLTAQEQLRLQTSAQRSGVELTASRELGALGLTRLAIYVLSLPVPERETRWAELDAALAAAAAKVVRRTGLELGPTELIADNSYSSSGSAQKRQRPLALALAAHYLVQAAATRATTRWTTPPPPGVGLAGLRAGGHTDLATPILASLREGPRHLLIISDGYDNDPPGAAGELLRVFRARLDPAGEVSILHLSPAYDASSYEIKALSPRSELVPSLGIRDAEDLPTLLEFARFAEGRADLDDLQAHLEARARACVARMEGRA